MGLGYVKLHREAEDHEVFDDPWLWKVFTWCMMRANFRDSKVQRGSFTTGRIEAADRLRSSPSRVYRAFQRLEALGCVTLKSNNRFTTVTLCNYGSYQGDDEAERTTNEQRMNSQRTTSEQQMNNKKTLLEEGEESKEGKKGRKAAAAVPLPEVLQTPEFEAAWADWKAHRTEIKKALKPTQEAEQLRQFAQWGVPRGVAAIRHTILKGWQGVREPDTDHRQMPLMELPKLGGGRS
jgi:hypothetical protein